jgi:uncharacterized membrane protein
MHLIGTDWRGTLRRSWERIEGSSTSGGTMTPALTVGLLWLVFGGTHVALATRPARGRLVARFGENGFLALYSVVAAASFVALVGTYAVLRDEGAVGIGATGTSRAALIGVVAFGVALAVAGVLPYPSSSYALFQSTSSVEPRGLERITRHPFFVGTALLGVGHALLATRLAGTVFFAGLALLSVAGAWHQDRKLLAARGASHATFLERTSMTPFLAILAGRQRLAVGELPLGALVLGVAAAWGLRGVHASIFAHGGAYVIIAVVGGALMASIQAWQRVALRGRSALERALGPALVAIGIGHAAATVVFFPDGAAAILADGVAGAISDGSSADAKAAFWFGLFAPALVFFGWLTSHAIARDDGALLAMIAWFLLGTALLGVVVMPMSGFWTVLVVGVLMLRVVPQRPCNVGERAL